jgi:hypothetical protein
VGTCDNPNRRLDAGPKNLFVHTDVSCADTVSFTVPEILTHRLVVVVVVFHGFNTLGQVLNVSLEIVNVLLNVACCSP